jgi:hypothetical protein
MTCELISGYKWSGGADGQVSSAETVPSSLILVEVVALRSFCSNRYVYTCDNVGSGLYGLIDSSRCKFRSSVLSILLDLLLGT